MNNPRFDHLVVLMLENRSFDNLCGYLYEHDEPSHFVGKGEPVFDGVAGKDFVNTDGGDPPTEYHVRRAPWEKPENMFSPYPNAGEFYTPNINRQVYGKDEVPGDSRELPTTGLMGGFVEDYLRAIEDAKSWDGSLEPTPEMVQQIMDCFPPEAVPVLSTLGREYAVSDAWFSSVPSSTWPNRSFAHSATSRGRVANHPAKEWTLHHDQPTIFDRLHDKLGKNAWRVYGEETHLASLTFLLHRPTRRWRYRHHFQRMEQFEADCQTGNLPAYSFLEPRSLMNPNDMHPPFWLHPHVASSVLAGEVFIQQVYDVLRNGKHWDRTLFVVTFDEHGGLFDHVPPPANATPPDDPPVAGDEGFLFDRFGLRVPTILVSPWIRKGTVIRSGTDTPFDHTSIIRTLCDRFDLEPLTERDKAAPSFASVLNADAPRGESPDIESRPYEPMPEPLAHESPLGHLGHQVLELTAAVGGHVMPAIEKTGHAIRHLLHHAPKHERRRGDDV